MSSPNGSWGTCHTGQHVSLLFVSLFKHIFDNSRPTMVDQYLTLLSYCSLLTPTLTIQTRQSIKSFSSLSSCRALVPADDRLRTSLVAWTRTAGQGSALTGGCPRAATAVHSEYVIMIRITIICRQTKRILRRSDWERQGSNIFIKVTTVPPR